MNADVASLHAPPVAETLYDVRRQQEGIELIRPDEINRAYEWVVNKDVRYRFVIDMASLKGPT